MNEAIAHTQTGWTEQGGDDPSMSFVPPLRDRKAQGTPWSADSTKPGSEALAPMDSLASLALYIRHTTASSFVEHSPAKLSRLRKLMKIW